MEKDNIVQIDSFIPGMKKGKPITLMKGTPNQKTLMLEMPGGKMSARLTNKKKHMVLQI